MTGTGSAGSGAVRAATDLPALTARSRPLEPADDLLDHLHDPGGLIWLRGGDGFVAAGTAARIEVGTGPGRFARAGQQLGLLAARARLDDPLGLPGSGLIAMASFTFDDAAGGSVLTVPEVVVGRRSGRGWVTAIGTADPHPLPPRPAAPPDRPQDRVRYAGASIPELHWMAAVAGAVERIESGELRKVVLARDHAVWSREPFDARVLARRLARRFPQCITFLCDGLVGATPELLVSRRGRRVDSLVLAGSARRGATPEEDRAVGVDLLASAKDREEHDLAVDSVRDVLAARCGTLEVDPEPWLLRLDNVQHLATRLTGRLEGRAGDATEVPTALELAGALHPTAAVGGAPRREALAAIRELEPMDRGRYAAPVGWVDASGDGEFGIALRCAALSGARARLFAGAGIVAGSLPEAELEETRLKLNAMRTAFGDPDA